jgi:hypothetical protein
MPEGAAPAAGEPFISPDDEDIPPLASLVPSIFVPLREDITKPLDPPRDENHRIDRLKRILESLDHQRKEVRANLEWMFEREKTRIIRESKRREIERGEQEAKVGLHPDEVESMIKNMEEPANPSMDYNIRDMPYPDFSNKPASADLSVREQTARELLKLVENATMQLTGFGKHMDDMRKYYEGCLTKELAKMDEIGLRPEERAKTAGSRV